MDRDNGPNLISIDNFGGRDMNQKAHLILNNGNDITADVRFCKYNQETKKYDVTFQSGKTYSYNYNSIEWIRDPEAVNPAFVQIVHGERELFSIREIYVFHATADDHWHVCFLDGSVRTYPKRELKITHSCLSEGESQNCVNYLRQIAAINELRGDNGEALLQKQYEKLDFVGDDTAMAIYMNPEKHKNQTYNKPNLIFPFGGNASQFQAVRQALNNQISIIQGPPGTGKTQTILNIIANLLIDGTSVQIVSNNNSATKNVLEKLALPKYNMGFLAAALGNKDNKKDFVANQSGVYPTLSDWEISKEKQRELQSKISSHVDGLSSVFADQERLAQARLELNSLRLEIRYFEQYCSETGLADNGTAPRRRLKSGTIMKLWQECNDFSERDRVLSFWFKLKSTFVYGISDWKFYESNLPTVITLFQALFYQAHESELIEEITRLEKRLAAADAKRKMDELTEWSMDYLRAKLFERYGNQADRPEFTEDDLWKQPEAVVKEYPIILSTTFSSRSCLKGVIYDYLIMDEASQVDIATGALALSGAQNAVIVGDLKQLPNVVKDDMKKQSDAIFSSYNLLSGYSFSENSFLKSVCNILPDAPQILLREHYRCHPKIIGFCNQKFYDNQLVIMTEDSGEADPLMLLKTALGDHRRDHTNQRQIDVTIREALPMIQAQDLEEIGIVAPYKDQVAAITKQLDTKQIEVATVHKFQGREKDTIVMTPVDDVVTDFSDDPYLLNVAVSRAKKQFCLVASGNDQPSDSNIGDLIDYIEYNNFQVVQSEIYSVFDLLYKQYTDARIAFLEKHTRISAYDSENLMYHAIADLLKSRSQLSLDVICHQPLNMLIRDLKHLTDEECRYAMNTATHVDFLIYNRISKKPVLAIEVDGFHYHKEGTQQYERDRIKDRILQLYGIPLLRFATNGSDEIHRIGKALDEYEAGKNGARI